MRIENTLTEADVIRSQTVPMSADMLAAASQTGLQAIDGFFRESVDPVVQKLARTETSDRQLAFIGLYYRIHALVQTALVLTHTRHTQSLSTAARSVIELYLDMEILHHNKFTDGVERLHVFTDAQRLAYARKTVAFYDRYPEFDRRATVEMQRFIARAAAAIDARAAQLWGSQANGNPRVPEHWTNRSVKARAEMLGPQFEKMVVDGYDVRNWLVHSGLAGVTGLDPESLAALCSLSLSNLHENAVESLKVLVLEVGADIDLDRTITELRRLPGSVLTDLQLRSIGEPQRVTVFSG